MADHDAGKKEFSPYIPASQSLPEITGEALVGILLAIPFAATQSTNVLNIAPAGFETPAKIIGMATGVGFAFWLYRTSLRSNE